MHAAAVMSSLKKSAETRENSPAVTHSSKELTANTSEGAQEKHLPVVEQEGNRVTVKVGSVFHPMSQEHSIEWVYLQTEKGCQRVNLSATDEPVAVFFWRRVTVRWLHMPTVICTDFGRQRFNFYCKVCVSAAYLFWWNTHFCPQG